MQQLSIAAILLPISIFLFWLVTGYALLSLLRTQRHIIQNILLAPTLGMVMTLLPTFWLNRLGFPVLQFGLLETIFLFIFALGILYKTKPLFPIRYYLPFALTLGFSLILVGYPLLLYGFNWISYGNDDMANYCLSALRLLHYGYSQTPTLTTLKSHQDMSLYYWFMTVPGKTRAGADLLLAWCSAVTHLKPIEIFMPLILALNLCLISATGSLIYQSARYRSIALAVMIVLTFSALNTLGTIYQLIAQVGGLAILLSLATFLLQPFTNYYRLVALKQSILISTLGMALLIFYPEITGFLLVSTLFYFSISFFQGWRPNKQFILTGFFSLVICLVILNQYWIDIIVFAHLQALAGLSNLRNDLFPYFLFPNGLADLWGLQVVAQIPDEPWLSRSIVLGGLLLLITVIAGLYQALKKIPIAVIFLVIFIVTLYFFIQHSGFTLFKLAMYMQPFLIGVLVIFIFQKIPKSSIRILVLVLLCYFSWQSQNTYLSFSKGNLGQPYVEIVGASIHHMNDELKKNMASIPDHSEIIVTAHNVVIAKIISIYGKNKYLNFPSKQFFIYAQWMRQSTDKSAYFLKNALLNQEKSTYFYLHNPNMPLQTAQFIIPYFHPSLNTRLILESTNRDIINRNSVPNSDKNYLILPWEKATNLLVYISSTLGQEYYFGYPKNISLYHEEKDYFYPNHSIAGIGRYLLFTIIHPTPKFRVKLEITNTLKGKNAYDLPHAMIEGTQRKAFPLIGAGSARVFSPIIEPQQIQNQPYIMLDLAKSADPVRSHYQGLMNLYGKSIILDMRHIVTYARSISVISEEDYQKMKIPVGVYLPDSLVNPNLEYSGIFEDGWISKDVFLVLGHNKNQHVLSIKGTIPLIKDKDYISKLTINFNGEELTTKILSVGDFSINIPIKSNIAKNKIELHFTKTQFLGEQDPREIAAKLNYIGFTA